LLTSNKLGPDTERRINVVVSTNNGFKIAEEDLAMRGPGDLYGTRQSGEFKFKIADIVTDVAILEQTRNAALQLISEDPGLRMPQHMALRELILPKTRQSHWGKIS
jgi:ATP-dependent DNA helicase RecG